MDSLEQQLVALNRSLPKDHVIGAICTQHDAETAVQALKDSGCRAEDILLVPGEIFIEDIRKIRQQTNPVRQALHVFFTSNDAGFPADNYLEHARQGCHILHVYAATPERAQAIAQVLRAYGPRSLKYFGLLAVTDF